MWLKGLTAQVSDVVTFAHFKSYPLTSCFIDHSFMCLTHFLPSVPHHLRLFRLFTAHDWNLEILLRHSAQKITLLAVWSYPLPSAVSRRRSREKQLQHWLQRPHLHNRTPDMKEVGQSTSPLLFQEREVRSNPFCFRVFSCKRQAVVASSKHHQV